MNNQAIFEVFNGELVALTRDGQFATVHMNYAEFGYSLVMFVEFEDGTLTAVPTREISRLMVA